MQQKIRRSVGLLLSLVILLTCFGTLPVHALTSDDLQCTGACIMDYRTGEILWEKQGYERMALASMTKVMTARLVLEAIRDGRITTQTRVPISQAVYTLSRDPDYWNVPLAYDTLYTVDEMLHAMICYSACGAALALAELVSGSEAAFVRQMNARAAALGLGATFADSYGASEYNVISPVDMAYLCCGVIRDFPNFLSYSAKPTFDFHNVVYESTNSLLFEGYTHAGVVDGLKTGTTKAAGYCISVSAIRGDERLVLVVMHAPSSKARYDDAVAMLDAGFQAIDDRFQAGWRYATPSSCAICVNGQAWSVPTWRIDDYNYLRLRDLACMLQYTAGAFDLSYREQDETIWLDLRGNYERLGTEFGEISGMERWTRPTAAPIYVDGASASLQTCLIDGNHFVKLRDIADIVGFTVDWSERDQCVYITAELPAPVCQE